MATRINLVTAAANYLPPSRAWLLDDGRVIVEHVGRTEFADIEAARRQFPSTEFVVTDEQVDDAAP
jgi:hypothetical protein